MIHAGNAITVQMLSDGIAEFRFDLQGESVNKFNRATSLLRLNLHLSLAQILLNLVQTSLKANKRLWIGHCLFTTSSTRLKI